MSLGVYVHFPYCRRHCPYCDFNVTVRPIDQARYRDAVLAELGARGSAFEGPAVSVYFGGGTPGLWDAAHLGAVIACVRDTLGLTADAEVTVEHNPEDVTPEGLAALRHAGVTRLSLGCQSFDDGRLAFLGRGHTAADNRRAMGQARAAGFEDVSVDVVWGLVGQRLPEVLADIDAACDLDPTHVSTYQLTIEQKTSFGLRARRGETLQVDEDVQAQMYLAVRERLRDRGLLPYEISNAARPGYEAVHNSLYWSGVPYLGLGAGAHGYDGAARWENERHAGRYASAALAGAPAEVFRDTLTEEQRLAESVLCGLRLDAGFVPTDAARARFGANAERLRAEGLLDTERGRWRATDRGRLFLDTIISRLTG